MKQKKVERQASCMKQKTFVQGEDKDEFHDFDHYRELRMNYMEFTISIYDCNS